MTNHSFLLRLLWSRLSLIAVATLVIASLILASLPLMGLLGFEYCLFFGLIATIVSTHYSLAAMRRRAQMANGPSFVGTVVSIWVLTTFFLLFPLAHMFINALRIPNCNLLKGVFLFMLLPGVGVFFGTGLGVLLASLPGKRLPGILVYVLPILGILWSVYVCLRYPPINVYNPFFGYYPGTIYDELREISSTFILYRGTTVLWSLLFMGLAALLAGKQGVLGSQYFAWRTPTFSRVQGAIDGRVKWSGSFESSAGAVFIFLASFSLLVTAHFHRHELGYEQDDLSIQEALGGRLDTKHFTIFYDQNSMKKERLQRIARDHEFRFHQLVKLFGHKPKKKIKSYLFNSSRQKSKLMGAGRTMIARPWAYELYIHGNVFPHRVLKHEMAHVFSAQFGSGPLRLSAQYHVLFSPAMIEGVAVAADWDSGSLTPHQWSHAMINLGFAPSPSEILGPWGFFKHASSRSYTIAGSFSKYLMDTYGIKKYKQAYGRADFINVYRKSLKDLSDDWKYYLKTKVPLNAHEQEIAANRFRRHRSIFARVCAHEMASLRQKASRFYGLSRYQQAIKVQKRICGIARTPYNNRRLINMYYDSKQYKKGVELALDMLDKYPGKKYPVLYAQFRGLLGMLYYRQGKHREAREIFEELSKRPLTLYKQRTVHIRLFALSNPKFRSIILDYLDGSSKTKNLLQLQKTVLQNPSEPVPVYLLARRLYYADQYKEAITMLNRVLTKFKSSALRIESQRLIAVSQFYIGSYDQAAASFAKLAKMPIPKGRKNSALDWKERALWEKKQYGRSPILIK